ncbi:BhlA/UviB family holin-like peptide [Clostridium sp. UBA6640]|nr:BhlA/UviB family holin-like peptide [Clostridium sp. UBA6640]
MNSTIDKNQSIIQDLATKLKVIEDIKKDVQDIKNKIN